MKIYNINNDTSFFKVKYKPLALSMKKISYQDLLDAYWYCAKRKGTKKATKDFERDLIKNIDLLYQEINSKNYRIGTTKAFVVTDPKVREIFCSEYRDRIIHHLIYEQIGLYFERKFISTTYSCIKGKGTLIGAVDAYRAAKRITNNWDVKHYKHRSFYLKLDISNYFMSIDRSILYGLIEKHFEPGAIILDLIHQVIFNDFVACSEQIAPYKFKLVPKHKSMYHAKQGCGLPIGNLSSQFFSNIYLNELDQYVKHVLKIKHYFRYVDDILILDNDESKLIYFHDKIKEFLATKLNLELAEHKTKYGNIFDGIDFIGYVLRPHHAILRKNTLSKLNVVVQSASQLTIYDFDEITKYVARINSYLGFLRYVRGYNARKQVCEALCREDTYIRYVGNYDYLYLSKEAAIKLVYPIYLRRITNMRASNTLISDKLIRLKQQVDNNSLFKREAEVVKEHEKREKKLIRKYRGIEYVDYKPTPEPPKRDAKRIRSFHQFYNSPEFLAEATQVPYSILNQIYEPGDCYQFNLPNTVPQPPVDGST